MIYLFIHPSIYTSICLFCPSIHQSPFKAPEWRSGLRHCISVLEASVQTLVRSRAVLQPAVIWSPIERRAIGPAPSG